MATFQEDFYLETPSVLRRLWRNVRLFGYVLYVVWFWLVLGGRVRRAVRKAERSGEPFVIDSLGE